LELVPGGISLPDVDVPRSVQSRFAKENVLPGDPAQLIVIQLLKVFAEDGLLGKAIVESNHLSLLGSISSQRVTSPKSSMSRVWVALTRAFPLNFLSLAQANAKNSGVAPQREVIVLKYFWR
jgi:hypothetical protein